jgi:RNA polymerase sigma-70 factor (ECF subfamily)
MESQTACKTSAGLAGDASLVRSALEGCRAAFETLVERHQRSAIATCLAVLRDRQLAEDAAQDAFLAAYQSLKSLRDPSTFGGWLLSIARNRATRLVRQRSRNHQTIRVYAEASERSVNPEDLLSDETLLTTLAALPDHERSVVMLRYFDGHPVADIAAITGRPIGTVTKQLQRAHERLRKALRETP